MNSRRSLVAGWSFTSRCNLRCRHCYNASGECKSNELTLGEAFSVARKLKLAGVVAVNFGGGECCLRKDFFHLCRYIKSLGMQISYTTNGTMQKLIEKNRGLFHDIGVSIDFPDARRHDDFRGMNGAFNAAVSTLRQLVALGVDTEIVTCLTRKNCSIDDLKGMLELASRLDVGYLRLNRFRPNGRGIDNKRELSLSKNNLRQAYTFLSQFYSQNAQGLCSNGSNGSRSDGKCCVSMPEPIFRAAFGGSYIQEGDPSGFTAFRIQPGGEVTPSVFLKESGGNIREKSVEEIMQSPIFRKIRNRKPFGKCKECSAYEHCRGGDAGASYLEYGHFNGPDPLCWLLPNEVSADTRKIQGNVQAGDFNVHEMYLCTVYIPIAVGRATQRPEVSEVINHALKAAQA